MRRACLFAALLVVLVANGWGVWKSIQNRAERRGGTLQLTEHELPLERVAFESSATVIRLEWRTERARNDRFGPAAWLDSGKLAELGFDCSVPLESANAPRHYSSTPARRVFLALEYHNAAADAAAQGRATTGLVVIDADQRAERLRQLYPDPLKHSICRGIVRIALRRHDAEGKLLSTPRLEGWVSGLVPSHVSVPKPANRLLAGFLWRVDEAEKAPTIEPRFGARVQWGNNYEPWVNEVRPFGSSAP